MQITISAIQVGTFAVLVCIARAINSQICACMKVKRKIHLFRIQNNNTKSECKCDAGQFSFVIASIRISHYKFFATPIEFISSFRALQHQMYLHAIAC